MFVFDINYLPKFPIWGFQLNNLIFELILKKKVHNIYFLVNVCFWYLNYSPWLIDKLPDKPYFVYLL